MNYTMWNKTDGMAYARQKKKEQTSVTYRRKAREWASNLKEWPLVMNTTQLAAILNLHPSTLAKWRRNGVGPDWTLQNGVRPIYRKEDVELWLENMKEHRDDYTNRVVATKRMAGQANLKIKVKADTRPKGRGRQTIAPHLAFRK